MALRHHVHRAFGLELAYALDVPDPWPAGDVPLVLFLHGAGERGSDGRRQLSYLEPWLDGHLSKVPRVLLAPQCPERLQWVDTPFDGGSYSSERVAESRPMRVVRDIIAQVRRDFTIGALHLSGLSMGGYGVWDFAVRTPEQVASVLAICGGGDPRRAARLAAHPVWAFHGERDLAVPVSGSRDMIDALRAAGGQPHYTEFAGAGHLIWNTVFADPAVLAWQLEGTPPR